MKKTFIILGLLSTLVACKEEAPVDYAIVEGNIANLEGKELALNEVTGTYRSTIALAADGSFVDTLKNNSGAYTLTDGKHKMRFYVENGDRLKVNYDASDAGNTLKFEGTAATTAEYYKAKEKISEALEVGKQNIYTLEESEFLAFLNKVKQAHMDVLTESKSLPKSFVAKERENIKFEYLTQVNNYEAYHGYYTKNPDFKASENITAQLADINLEDLESYRFSAAYKSLLTGTYNQKASELVKKDSLDQSIALLKAISTNKNEEIRDELMFDNVKVYLSYSEDPKAYYELYMANASNEEYMAEVKKDYEKLLTLGEGKPSPEFKDYENFEGGTTSLSDLRGTYVYIDVWATWCGPCKREIPFLKQLEADYHDKNITFLSISIDAKKDHDKWQRMVEEKELGGVQVFADNDWESQFVQDYMIKGIPRFILLDPEGNIVRSNAPRPSSDDIRELFTALNI